MRKKGWKLSEETKDKMRKSHKGFSGFTHKKETREKMSKNNVGMKGKKHSLETRKKLSEYKGEKAANWRGGISENPYPNDWTLLLRESIRQRDNFICQECGIHEEELNGFNKKHDIHHIDYDKENCDPINLITLCRSCHLKTNYNREHWIEYFTNK